MLDTIRGWMVLTEADFDCLPPEGRFEVVEGRAILLPPKDYEHQVLSDELLLLFKLRLKALPIGYVASCVNVFIPRAEGAVGDVQNRVPDLVVSKHKPQRRFAAGNPPDLVIEVLATRRGNVERTEKLDDYARAGIGEYWIVNRFDRAIEVYVLREGEDVLREIVTEGTLTPVAFPGLEIDLDQLWPVLD